MSKSTRLFSVIALVILLAATFAVPAFAQTSITKTWTESQVNSSYRITHNSYRVSNKSVDLQTGQVLLSATVTPRNGGTSYNLGVTMVPSISNGRVTWSVTSVTNNGAAASGNAITIANNVIAATYRNWFKGQFTGRATSISITDTEMNIIYTR